MLESKPKMKKFVSKPAQSKLPKNDDVLLIHGLSEDGESCSVLRKRGNKLEAGVVRPMKEGRPIEGDVVKLRPIPEMPLVFNVEVQYSARGADDVASEITDTSPTESSEGQETEHAEARERFEHVRGNRPAIVATEQYRNGWDTIWGRRSSNRLPN